MNKIDKVILKQGFSSLEIKIKCYKLSLTGFTLVELLVVVIVVGILSSVAIPIFRQSVRRVMASEGQALVGAIRTAQRIYFAEKNQYTPNWIDIEGNIEISNKKYFSSAPPTLTASGTGSGAVFTATVIGAGDASGITISINQAGVITTSGL
ncbi:MAG: prepilin-type N-terminal cleavage/methylation domain-containing protein [Candidatus Omnitrophica bacterium]|nr:prepilin-type N-terminal cleavage/methylation domain-containing protein [Candidatus Omnitrophota bacterium]MBU1047057.1 prepilin-type N-terminal cleavage/methylation domain-containing protein [Candidatus Omnitrophota bacterium]MBU1767488.1 prepilin-type N-terminal cleavage/methylation domain-containing protein [Candidatus Omnitrophota bacterium]MBU1889273.1 prepilin-type N-terminal cleavage/methylation domain-containing protein [Candidatus Omnitrophota bacterium]